MGFGNLWRFWIRGCVASSRSFVLINGCPTDEYKILKGVRKGDLLSPFLFTLAMEGLNVAMNSTFQSALFNGIQIPNNGPSISHIFYSDDVIFFGDWFFSNFQNMVRILGCFYFPSDLKVNFHKSRVFGIGVGDSELFSCANILGYETLSFPFIYLGSQWGRTWPSNVIRNL